LGIHILYDGRHQSICKFVEIHVLLHFFVKLVNIPLILPEYPFG
jgi:hypothetical protein